MLSTESGKRQFALRHSASGPGLKCGPRPHVIDPSSVTVAVEGWNAADLDNQEVFRRSLTSLRDQTYPIRECEVFVFLDAEVDLSRMDWIGELIPHAKIVSVPGSTYYRTKNLALQFARGKYLVFADSDVVYDQRWLESLLGCIADGKELIAGWTRDQPGLLSRTLELCDWSATRPISEYTDWFYGNNLAVRRGLFERLRFREDMGLSGGGAVNVLRRQLREDGIRAWFCADAIAYHALAPFLPKRLRLGGYHVLWRRLSPASSLGVDGASAPIGSLPSNWRDSASCLGARVAAPIVAPWASVHPSRLLSDDRIGKGRRGSWRRPLYVGSRVDQPSLWMV